MRRKHVSLALSLLVIAGSVLSACQPMTVVQTVEVPGEVVRTSWCADAVS
jgi:hypothetical protein